MYYVEMWRWIKKRQSHTVTHRAVSLEATVTQAGVTSLVNSICRAGGIEITKWLLSAIKRGGQALFIFFICFGKENESNCKTYCSSTEQYFAVKC